jgi:hypothetical protein
MAAGEMIDRIVDRTEPDALRFTQEVRMLDTSSVTTSTPGMTPTPIPAPTPETAEAARTGQRPDGRLATSVVAIHGLAWVAALTVLEIIAPAADPNAVMPDYAVILSMAFTISLGWTLVGLVRHQRQGIWASMAGGAVMAIAAVSCGLEGHTGLWIPTQLVLGLGLIGLGRRSLQGD